MADWNEDSAWKAGLTAALLGAMHARPKAPRANEGFTRALLGGRDLRDTAWYADLAARYGARNARLASELVASPAYRRYFWQGGPARTGQDAAAYANVRDIVNRLGGDPDLGRAVVGGSMSINKTETLRRPTAVVHDLDLNAYTANATKVPWEPYPFPLNPKDPNGVAPGWYDRFIAPMEDWRLAAENAPILQRIREQFPETHGDAQIAGWNWRTMRMDSQDDRYKPGVFQQIGDGYSTSRTAGHNIFLGTRINGVPIDLFLSNARIDRIPGTPYAPPEVAFTWKNSYADDGGVMRPKDSTDFLLRRKFSRVNPIVDLETLEAQFSPVNFGDRILSDEGLPAVYDVETWPQSGITVPMTMNTKGVMKFPFVRPDEFREDAKGGESADDLGDFISELPPDDDLGDFIFENKL